MTTDPKTHLPISTAKTAYSLLSDIAQLALDEPKRMRMATVLAVGDTNSFPACKTVGCIAGWTDMLTTTSATMEWGEIIMERATATLGLTTRQRDELFCDGRLCGARNQQTPKHAKSVVAHIRRFQKKNRAQLIAKKVTTLSTKAR